MSLTLTKKSSKQKAASDENSEFDYSLLPQVNLLPTEIRDRRSLKKLKVRIGFFFLGLIAFVILGYVAVQVEKSMAEARYERAVEQTAKLKAEEVKYAEVPKVLGQIKDATTALRDGMYREILWKDYIGAVAGTVPDGGIVKSLSVEAATPNNAGPQAGDNLQNTGIGELTFSVNLKTMPDTAAWINELNKIKGFSEARLEAATLAGDSDGREAYEFTGSVRLTEDIYSHRFEPDDLEESIDESDS
ncbi:PilN domain-containing protein [Timonella senegalensis]|uniref:PilN domain-containing protein n=1 Tax=Timonella senegalensis TaxID=1465825 RepID=UPI0002E99CA5|nr:hypothetical protein [Timonella senegalensis]